MLETFSLKIYNFLTSSENELQKIRDLIMCVLSFLSASFEICTGLMMVFCISEMFAHNCGLSKGGDDGVRDLTHFWNVDLLQLLLIFYCPATFFSLKTAILLMEAEC